MFAMTILFLKILKFVIQINSETYVSSDIRSKKNEKFTLAEPRKRLRGQVS
jgi:hypothetical protein